MAITYLSGERIQGHSNPNNIVEGYGTEQINTDFSSSTGWTKVGTKWLVDASTDNRVESLSYSSYAPNDYVYHDMGASFHACDQSFILRYKILAVGAGGYIQVGFTDNTTDGNSGDSLNAGLNSYGSAYGYTRIYDTVNGTFHEVETASTTTPSGMYNTAIWMEFAFNSTTNVATVKCFSDSGFTTPLNAGTQNLSHTLTMSDYQGLRYLFIGSIDASGRTLDSNCYVDDLTLYTGSTTIVSDKSTITNVPAGTRYEETDTRKIFYRAGTPFLTAWLEKGTAATLPIARGCWAGGNAGSTYNVIDYITIASVGNATDFGNLLAAKNENAGLADSTRGCFGGGHDGNYVNVIEYITVASVGNATDFGDLTSGRQALAGLADSTRGCYGGGSQNIIDYITIQTTGNATDFGDLSVSRANSAGLADATRGCFAGGYNSDVIDYITIQTTGNATDFGNITAARSGGGGFSDTTTRGGYGGGSGNSNIIDYITIATTGNATDFGDLTVGRGALAACASQTRGCFGAGHSGSAEVTVDYITIATTGNATDFGDLTTARNSLGALAA